MPVQRFLQWLGVVGFAVVSAYSLLGVLQALSLFQGERALWNVNLWASLALIAAVAAWLLTPKEVQPSQPSTLQRLMPWVHAGFALFFAWQVISHLASVDQCLDRGGSFDYLAGRCDFEHSLPFVPLHRTHGFPIIAVAAFSLLAIRGHLRLRSARRRAPSAA